MKLAPVARDLYLVLELLNKVENVYARNLEKGNNVDYTLKAEELKGLQAVGEQVCGLADQVRIGFQLKFTLTNALQLKLFGHQTGVYAKDALRRIRETKNAIVNELGNVKFLPASAELENYLDQKLPFGEKVATAFPKCSEDISEAHQCFGFARYTACVFHLGRAMELAAKRLAKRVRAKAASDEWQSYITAINDAINGMPFKTAKDKARRALFSEASNYLFNFTEAWRNPTVHPKRTYTREQALDVLNNARAFFQHVSAKIFQRSR